MLRTGKRKLSLAGGRLASPTRVWTVEVLMGAMLPAVKAVDVGAEKYQRPEEPFLSLPSSGYFSSSLEVPVFLQTKNACRQDT